MATGDVKFAANCKKSICLMTGVIANTGAPALATDGVPCYPDESKPFAGGNPTAFYTSKCARESTLAIKSTAGSGVMVGTFTLWGYLAASASWHPIAINATPAAPTVSVALAELASPGDTIRFSQRLCNLGHWDRLFLELAAVGGTATAFEAWLTTGLEMP